MNYPEFHSVSYKIGDRVQVIGLDGNLHPGEIVEAHKSGRYSVRTAERTLEVKKDKIFPAPSTTSFAEPEKTQGNDKHDEQSLGKHLKSGGKAYYYPPGEDTPVPVHDIWFGKEENLPQFINFDAVRSGEARIDHDEPQEKPKPPKFRGLTKSEVGVYLRSGSEFTYFDSDVKATKHDGGHSLDEMMADRSLATDENVEAWFNHQMEMEKSRSRPTQSPAVPSSGANDLPIITPDESATNQVASEGEQSATSKALDNAQVGLDAVGAAEPTPFADGTNAAISLVRAGMEPDRAGEHIKNAAISVVSMIPYVGDLAKGAKYAGKASKAGKAAKGANQSAKAATSQPSAGAVAAPAGPGQGGFLNSLTSFFGGFFGGGGAGGSPTGQGGAGGTGGGGAGGGSPPTSPGSPTPGGSSNNAPVLNLDKLIDGTVVAAGVLGTLGKKGYDFANQLDIVNRQMIEYNRGLARFSGTLSAAYGKLDADRLLREIKSAGIQSESLSGLIGAQSKLEDALQELKGDWRVVGNDVQQVLTKVGTSIISILDKISPLEEWYKSIRKSLVEIGLLDGNANNGQQGFPQALRDARKRAEQIQKTPRKIK